MASEQKILIASSPEGLNSKIKSHLEDGWITVGSHTATPRHSQLVYAGRQHMETRHTADFCQTVKRKIKC
jgi:hypothetical protein